MKKDISFFNRSYYKIRIIITFCAVTVILVVLISLTGYVFVKDLYLNNLTEKVNNVTGLLANQINKSYLGLLEIGPPTETVRNYFDELFSGYIRIEPNSDLFIFEKNFNVIVHSNKDFITGIREQRLQINEKEIYELPVESSTTSMPFKGDDGKWYLWGFNRLNENQWLGIKVSASKLKEIDQLAVKFILIGAAGIIITFIFSWIIAKSISRPVEVLSNYSLEIGKGNFEVALPIGVKGEFDNLAKVLDKMKTDLAANQKEREKILAQIAHEIRNPLGGIELLAGLTKEDLIKNELSTGYIEKIINEINGLKKLITSFLEFSKPAPVNSKICNLNDLIDESFVNLKGSLGTKKINLIKDLKKKEIIFDRGHLKQILTNIIGNSIDAINEDGIISISTKEEKGNWYIVISDNGKGISGEDLQFIFDPFYTTKKNGTGLGLAICKKLCMENRAKIEIDSDGNNGTKIIISGEVESEI